MKLIFLHADKNQIFLQVGFNTLDIKVFSKVILSLLMGMNKHSQSNKLEIALQYAIEEVSCRAFQYKFDEESLTRAMKYLVPQLLLC